jgi:hypothetical protein
MKNQRRQSRADGRCARDCGPGFLIAVFASSAAGPSSLVFARFRALTILAQALDYRMKPTCSLTAATELSRAKSISETSISRYRTAALNSSDTDARLGINEAMLTPVTKWRTRRRVDVCEEKS